MATLSDTHGFIKGLTEAGMPENQAEAIAEGLKVNRNDVVTKADLAELETRLTVRIATLIGIAVAVQSVIIAAIKLVG